MALRARTRAAPVSTITFHRWPGLVPELALRHVPPPGPATVQADDPDATVLGPEAVEFGRLDLPGLAHLGGAEVEEGQGGRDDEECGPRRRWLWTPESPGPMGQHNGRHFESTSSNGCPPGPGDSDPRPFPDIPGEPLQRCDAFTVHHDPPSVIDTVVSAQDPATGPRHDLFGGRRGLSATSPGPGADGRGPAGPSPRIRGRTRSGGPGPRTAATRTPGWSSPRPGRSGEAAPRWPGLAVAARPRGDEPGLDQPEQPRGDPLRRPLPERSQGRCSLDTSHFHYPC